MISPSRSVLRGLMRCGQEHRGDSCDRAPGGRQTDSGSGGAVHGETREHAQTTTEVYEVQSQRQDPATSRQVVQMRRETVHIIQKQVKIPQREGRCKDCAAQRPHDEGGEHLVCRPQVQRLHMLTGKSNEHVCAEKCPLTTRHFAEAAVAAEKQDC